MNNYKFMIPFFFTGTAVFILAVVSLLLDVGNVPEENVFMSKCIFYTIAGILFLIGLFLTHSYIKKGILNNKAFLWQIIFSVAGFFIGKLIAIIMIIIAGLAFLKLSIMGAIFEALNEYFGTASGTAYDIIVDDIILDNKKEDDKQN